MPPSEPGKKWIVLWSIDGNGAQMSVMCLVDRAAFAAEEVQLGPADQNVIAELRCLPPRA